MRQLHLAIAIGIMAILFYLGIEAVASVANAANEPAKLERVIDGDTLVVEKGRSVRLLGIDTPEKGQPYSEQATAFLEQAVRGKAIYLEKGGEDRDKYGRLLRYVRADGRLVNLELVRAGLARAYVFQNDSHTIELLALEKQAKQQGNGIWSVKYEHAFCIGISLFRYNARGDDRTNLNDEFVILRNGCDYQMDIASWKVLAGNDAYAFGNVTVGPHQSVVLHTGSGPDNSTDLFWNSTRPLWNNEHDKLIMRDQAGRLMLNYSYDNI
ncbi:MAG: thermonuclease family protein [Candidatus Aenigmarchaeota archaeon]|nr:thermonuclease family protein [Candidatus Aenigmarchaeota archaeon]